MTFESIGGTLAVAVDAHCRISEDGVLLARFAAPTATDTVCDLGTGNALLPLCWCRRDPPAHITAVEREAAFAALAQAAIDRFSLAPRITLICADWNEQEAMPQAGSMTLVTCNPPYFPFGASRPSPDPLRCAARQEDDPRMLDKLCAAATRLLTADGRFCLCHRPERLCDVLAAVREAGLVPRRLQFVQAHDGAAPWLFLLECARKGTLRVLPPLITHKRGTHTAVYKRLYR
ncbi:MAG: methyltransferase [Ruminococcaceae bacterium]|nr:methyltransferase [Oscillospiraceae bacterium]